MDEEWLSTTDAARRLGVSPQSVLKLISAGALRSRREPWGKRLVHRVSAEDVTARLTEKERAVVAPAGFDVGRLEQLELELMAARAHERELEARLAVRDAEVGRLRGDLDQLKALFAQSQQLALGAVERLGA